MRQFFSCSIGVVAGVILAGAVSVQAANLHKQNLNKVVKPEIHLDLDASSAQLQELLSAQKNKNSMLSSLQAGARNLLHIFKLADDSQSPDGQKAAPVSNPESIDQAIQLGERLFKWIELINANRDSEHQIRLTSNKTREGYPIDHPKSYSPRSVAESLVTLSQDMPAEMSEILYGAKELTQAVPVPDDVFVTYGRRMDKIYQTAERWALLINYKYAYIRAQAYDVRGYYYLTTNKWDDKSLNDWDKISSEDKNKIREAFVLICRNSGASKSTCQTESRAVTSGKMATDFYVQYFPAAREVYNGFFDIENPRQDIDWSSKNPNVATIPFIDPVTDEVRHFIKDDLEEEYAWQGWGLRINFINKGTAPYIAFVPGVTAHVEFLGGNRIEMDANKSLQEYEERWTIRHEFGHVLGLPDCYHEFYDDDNDQFVSYQLDITDIMCSRAGNFNQRVFDELKAAYSSN